MRATSRGLPSLSSPFWLPAISASLRQKFVLLETSGVRPRCRPMSRDRTPFRFPFTG